MAAKPDVFSLVGWMHMSAPVVFARSLGALLLVAAFAAPATAQGEGPRDQGKSGATAARSAVAEAEEQLRREAEGQFTIDSSTEPEAKQAEGSRLLRPTKPQPMWAVGLDAAWRLALVIGLICGVAWVLRRLRSPSVSDASTPGLRVVDTVRLSADRALHVVQARGHTFLIGSAPQSINLVAVLDGHTGYEPASDADALPAYSDSRRWPEDRAAAGPEDFFDRLVAAERGFELDDLPEPELEPPAPAPPAPPVRRSPALRPSDALERAMGVISSMEGRLDAPSAGRRHARPAGTYDRQGRL
ncbi:MAG TPA: flagellar biosynthetic protein FliO [Armatimonadota bacterium]|nr:flagellar biosynthetic protein FliO [Armatimonadota bacterium]HQK94159.1 flagellar biosynthetic protein FliO [Armatimonadota bacterium]